MFWSWLCALASGGSQELIAARNTLRAKIMGFKTVERRTERESERRVIEQFSLVCLCGFTFAGLLIVQIPAIRFRRVCARETCSLGSPPPKLSFGGWSPQKRTAVASQRFRHCGIPQVGTPVKGTDPDLLLTR